jgi:hypothetical protein
MSLNTTASRDPERHDDPVAKVICRTPEFSGLPHLPILGCQPHDTFFYP